MDTEELLAFVKEAIEDEQKLVTYKWLSITKNISMNQAKRVLKEFVSHNKGLTVYLCFIGYKTRDRQKTLNVKIIKAEEERYFLKDYEEATIHVYSVQKANGDPSLLYSCDYDVCKQLQFENRNLFGIYYDNVVVRSRKKCTEPLADSIPQAVKNEVQKKNMPTSADIKKSKPVLSISSFMQNKNKLQLNSCSDNSDSGFASAKCSMEDKKSDIISLSNVHNNAKDGQPPQKRHSKGKPQTNSCSDNSGSGFASAKDSNEVKKSDIISLFNGHNKAKDSQPPQKRQSNDETQHTESQPKRIVTSKSNKSQPALKLEETATKLSQKEKRRRIEVFSSSSDESKDEEECGMFDSSPPQMLGSRLALDERSKMEVRTSHDFQEAKENKNLNCMKKVSAIKTFVESDDEEFMTTQKVIEIVHIPVERTEMDVKVEKKVDKQEVPKKAQTSKKKQVVNDVKQSTIRSFFARK